MNIIVKIKNKMSSTLLLKKENAIKLIKEKPECKETIYMLFPELRKEVEEGDKLLFTSGTLLHSYKYPEAVYVILYSVGYWYVRNVTLDKEWKGKILTNENSYGEDCLMYHKGRPAITLNQFNRLCKQSSRDYKEFIKNPDEHKIAIQLSKTIDEIDLFRSNSKIKMRII